MARLHRITHKSVSYIELLSSFLISEGWPNTVWFLDADTGTPTCITMAPSCTIKSCLDSISWVA